MPGTAFIKSIGGEVQKPEYYSRITRSKIRDELNSTIKSDKIDIESYILGDVSFFGIGNSSKAATLVSLKPKLSKSLIEKLYVFTKWYHIKRGECCGKDCQNCPY